MPHLHPADLLERWLTDRPSAPLITYYGGDGVRIELSGATTTNTVHKAVNLFRYELGLQPGEVVWLDLPCHWQFPVLAIGVWGAGLTVAIGAEPPPGAAATLGTGSGRAVGDAWAVSQHPWGLPLGAATPSGWEDLAEVLRVQPDRASLEWPGPDLPWLLSNSPGRQRLTGRQLVDTAQHLAASWGAGACGRLVSPLPPASVAGLLAGTAVPAAIGGSVILSTSASLGEILRQEGNAVEVSDV